MMRALRLVGAWPTACSIALVQANNYIETDEPNVTAVLGGYGIDVSSLPVLTNLPEQSTSSSCSAACQSLHSLHGSDRVLIQDTATHADFKGSFWSNQQAEVQPYCIFKPAVNTDVAVAVLLSRLTGCPFAAKGGGHVPFRGASNSPGGITISFANMNDVSLSEDRSVASIGPGNVWGRVYGILEPYGLAVIGGRETSIGVGGLVTGGGISFYSNQYGLALDNVESFEVVIASGHIVTASATHYPDLYWALRGGGNNFGLITRFNLYTIPSSTMRRSRRVYMETQIPDVANAFASFARAGPSDGNAQQIVVFGRSEGKNFVQAELTYLIDVADPASFRPYKTIPAVSDTTESINLVQYSEKIEAIDTHSGHRNVFWTITVLLDESFASWAAQYFLEILSQVANVSGVSPSVVYQTLTEPMLANMTKYGGNALGLDNTQGPLHVFNVDFAWDNAADDETIYAFIHGYCNTVIGEAKKRGIAHDFIFMNYASQFQDVIASYGADSNARLKKTLQPGHFKLKGAPVVY
ncbi:FAD-binding oxidoreductase [Aspergillus alliaceus]|uniref:FAD-binding oxidoreductase n=1 Tax=Petromyces alliaceus TaxID=209559 RepID=UPI0012A457FC|nr:uncharacterized protein BDW43DRAFT_322183 [Aspergillus alliaceus]KAB8229390.1 hypothetical protein BDW43DRAFT_322183 [Aspergillus alliaceus]